MCSVFFDDVLPIKARWKRLNANFYLQTRLKSEGFGIHYAFNAHQTMRKTPKASCFAGFSANESIRRLHRLESTEPDGSLVRKTFDTFWKQRHEELVAAVATKYASGFIFR